MEQSCGPLAVEMVQDVGFKTGLAFEGRKFHAGIMKPRY
jgi:hypothetical protein